MKNFFVKYALIPFISIMASCIEKPEKKWQEPSAENQNETLGMQSWFLSTGDWETDPQIYVREFGNGTDTIVLLHGGWGAEHSGMIDIIRSLENEYKFFAHEQRGSLRSPFPDSLITYDNHIMDVELLRKELGLDKLTILGHSMGSVLASAYAQKFPEHIQKLVLVSPAFLKNPFPDEDIELLQNSQKAYENFSSNEKLDKELKHQNLLRVQPKLSSKEETIKNRINFANIMLYDIGKWNKLNNGKALYKDNVYGLTERTYPEKGWNFISEFKEQSYPISVIIGDHDRFDMGNHIFRKWTSEVPRAEFTSIKRAGHLLWIDQPKNLTKTLRQTLNN
ncbi:alpha/beta fold hydrolase [Croceitalea rosinachiae]|uniref:Alpha/beta hydrolase n=1 Tax=Croceitalea rosinachiae TaxID=3075596 RepID=A0ABU3AEB1_9FLAO|nr:alpha/beta hydrolase [Croceitalea sp. F388]MDT0608135.1 alpha/beta hydrolase [Croceitalea sp. F388]